MSEWISVNIKPEGNEERKVLVCIKQDNSGWCGMPLTDDERVFKAWWIPQRDCFAYKDLENANHKIEGWMPLPEPPKDELNE
jgi:hypothetical protein